MSNQPTQHPSVQGGSLYIAENISRAMKHLISGEDLPKRISAAASEISRINDSEHFTSCMSDETLKAFRDARFTKPFSETDFEELSRVADAVNFFVQGALHDLGLVAAGEDPKSWIRFTKVTNWEDELPRPVRNL